jgi:hypothetical protein
MDEAKNSGAGAREARREEWRRIVAEQQASGKSAAAYCRELDLPTWKFSYWQKRLATGSATSGGFEELRVVASTSGAAGQVWVEVGRWRVGVAPGFDGATLRRVVETLGTPCLA